MATRAATVINPTVIGKRAGDVLLYQWTGLLQSSLDVGAAVSVPALADRSVQLLGTLGTGGSVRIEGSNKAAPDESTNTDWAVLTDPQGNDLNLAALKIEAVTEPVLWIRPRVTAGDGTTSLTVILLLRK
jgi:hypothetical protein